MVATSSNKSQQIPDSDWPARPYTPKKVSEVNTSRYLAKRAVEEFWTPEPPPPSMAQIRSEQSLIWYRNAQSEDGGNTYIANIEFIEETYEIPVAADDPHENISRMKTCTRMVKQYVDYRDIAEIDAYERRYQD